MRDGRTRPRPPSLRRHCREDGDERDGRRPLAQRADQEGHHLQPAARRHGVHRPDVRRVHATVHAGLETRQDMRSENWLDLARPACRNHSHRHRGRAGPQHLQRQYEHRDQAEGRGVWGRRLIRESVDRTCRNAISVPASPIRVLAPVLSANNDTALPRRISHG